MASTASVIERLNITDAPSRDRLFDSMKYSYDRDDKIICEFTLEDGHVYGIEIEGLFHEDGSGHSFGFYGRLVSYNRRDSKQQAYFPSTKLFVRGWVYTKSPRHGLIEFSGQRLTFNQV